MGSTLYKMGVFDIASWFSGTSGGAWFVSMYYTNIMNDGDVKDPLQVWNELKTNALSPFFSDVFDMNEILTNYIQGFQPFYSPHKGATPATDEVICEGELRLQSKAAIYSGGSSILEYWSRAIARQIFTSNQPGGLGLCLSDFIQSNLLRSYNAPLPIFQVSCLSLCRWFSALLVSRPVTAEGTSGIWN